MRSHCSLAFRCNMQRCAQLPAFTHGYSPQAVCSFVICVLAMWLHHLITRTRAHTHKCQRIVTSVPVSTEITMSFLETFQTTLLSASRTIFSEAKDVLRLVLLPLHSCCWFIFFLGMSLQLYPFTRLPRKVGPYFLLFWTAYSNSLTAR